MVLENKEENLSSVLSQIKSAKNRGKKMIKVKVRQLDYTDGKLRVLYIMCGFGEGSKGEKVLLELGYTIQYENQKKQVSTGYDMRGNINKFAQRDLHTTSMIIRW